VLELERVHPEGTGCGGYSGGPHPILSGIEDAEDLIPISAKALEVFPSKSAGEILSRYNLGAVVEIYLSPVVSNLGNQWLDATCTLAYYCLP